MVISFTSAQPRIDLSRAIDDAAAAVLNLGHIEGGLKCWRIPTSIHGEFSHEIQKFMEIEWG
jgi:hypothetical protein